MSDLRIYPYRPLRAITTWTTILIVIKLIVLGLYIGLGATALVFGQAAASQMAALLYMIVHVVSGAVSLGWIYRAAGNARALSLPTLKPAWAVAWFFVPVYALFKPYQYVRDIWIAAHDLHVGSRDARPVLIWWLCFVVGDALTYIGWSTSASHLTQLPSLKGAVLSWIATLIFLYLVRRISRLQNSADG